MYRKWAPLGAMFEIENCVISPEQLSVLVVHVYGTMIYCIL